MQTRKGFKNGSVPIQQASAAARSLSILYNNSRVYGVEHPVFRKTLAEHMQYFQDALSDMDELLFTFLKGKLRCGELLLDPGSSVFQSLSHTMEGMGISGISIRRGVDSEEITKFISILTLEASDISSNGLQSMLRRDAVHHIAEQNATIEMDGRTKKEKTSTSVTKTFDLDDTVIDLDMEPGMRSKTESSFQFKNFVTNQLNDLSADQVKISLAADHISNEFQAQIEKATEELRGERDMAARRLESVKSVVFEKLEALNIMAILVATDLSILATTSAARRVLGNIVKLEPGSPLARCVVMKAAYMDITLMGKSFTVQTIASDSAPSGEIVLLLTLSPD